MEKVTLKTADPAAQSLTREIAQLYAGDTTTLELPLVAGADVSSYSGITLYTDTGAVVGDIGQVPPFSFKLTAAITSASGKNPFSIRLENPGSDDWHTLAFGFFDVREGPAAVDGDAVPADPLYLLPAETFAALAAMYTGTSSSELTIGAGTQSLTIEPEKAFGQGVYITITRAADPTIQFFAKVDTYDAETGDMDFTADRYAGGGGGGGWDPDGPPPV